MPQGTTSDQCPIAFSVKNIALYWVMFGYPISGLNSVVVFNSGVVIRWGSTVPSMVHCPQIGALFSSDMLFGPIYERFSSDAIATGTFLECLEPYILNDRLSSITPVVMKAFVDHYQQKGMVQNVEACIVHMDIASLDIHQVSGWGA